MFLRNYDAWRTGTSHNDGSADVEYTDDLSLLVKRVGGQTLLPSTVSWFPLRDIGNSFSSANKTLVVAGSGDTPVSYDDYKLDNYLSSVISSIPLRNNYAYNSINDTYESTVSAVLTNNSEYEVVIKEIGLAIGLSGSGYNSSILFFREVLEAPITLQPHSGTTISFTYSTEGHANMPETYYKITETLTNCTAAWNVGSTSSGEYRDTFTAASGYTLPASITVTMGGIAMPPMRYSYDSSTGAFSMTEITDDVVITVTA